MSDTAAPWWADVQHLRPREDGDGGAGDRPRGRRFERRPRAEEADAAVLTLEHAVEQPVHEMPADPWAVPPTEAERAARWAEVQGASWFESARRRAEAEDEAWLDHVVAGADGVAAEAPDQTLPWIEGRRTLSTTERADSETDGRADAAAADTHRASAAGAREAGASRHASAADEPEAQAAPPVWDEQLDEAFTEVPRWSEEEWLLPKGAMRIENGRRTIEIRGQADRVLGVAAASPGGDIAPRSGPRRRRSRNSVERFAGPRPDRVAMWAFLLGLLLILIAVLSDPGTAGAAVRPL